MSRRFCLALDLKDDPELIAEYEEHHRRVWPEVLDSIGRSGIMSMEIYRLQTRLVMLLEVDEEFSFERKAAADVADPKVQQWESLMWRYQQAIPGSSFKTSPASTSERLGDSSGIIAQHLGALSPERRK